ncbi:MAG TPA: MFS transporter [Mycobacteriales bacterium]|nr:MFS transporter [Mycobacteriales bacterium]
MEEGSRGLPAKPATYRSLFAERQFCSLWLAQVLSLTGDQLARVAIASLVYAETKSALITGLIYAVTYLPWLVGGPLLGGLADRYPRRTVMLICQLIAAVLVGLMAVPGMPLVALASLLFVVILAESPFLSARASLLVDILPDDRYVLASAVNQLTIQATQVLGFAVGGALVFQIGASDALAVDALTFLLAAALVRFGVQARAAAGNAAHLGGSWQRMKIGAKVVFGDPRLRGLVLLGWLATFWVVPEGLAAPYADGNSTSIGLLLAAQPAGSVAGGLVLSRMVRPIVRIELMGALAVLTSLPLLFFLTTPPIPVAVALLVVSGIGTTYNLPANAAFMQALPAERRGQAFGLVSAGLVAGQGISIAVAGAAAEASSPGVVICVAGVLGLVAALALSGAGKRFLASPSPVVG